MDWQVDNLAKERLDQPTHFGVISRDVGQGAPSASNKDLALLAFNARLAPKTGENFDCLLEPLFQRVRMRYPATPTQSTADFAQHRFELRRAKALFKLGKDSV